MKKLTLIAALTLCAAAVAVAAPASAAETPVLTGLSFPTATQNVTYAAGSLTLTAKAKNTDEIQVSVDVQSDSPDPVGPRNLAPPVMTRTAGTTADGTYSLTLPLAGGTRSTWQVNLVLVRRAADGTSATEQWSTSRLAAAGFAAQVKTTTTAGVVPPAPKSVTVRSEWFLGGNLALYQRWKATWAQSASGQPLAAEWVLSSSGKCVATTANVWLSSPAYGTHEGGTGTCTVTVRARNANGTSAATSGSTVFIG